jgi:hypothetical protein
MNILKFTTKNVKQDKKNAQNFFILKYVIERYKISRFYHKSLLV